VKKGGVFKDNPNQTIRDETKDGEGETFYDAIQEEELIEEERKWRNLRRRKTVTTEGSKKEATCILDSGSDICKIGVGWRIIERTEKRINLNGATAGMVEKNMEILGAATAVVQTNKGERLAFIHEGLFGENEGESLINCGQLWLNGIKIDLNPKMLGGKQEIETDDGTTISFRLPRGVPTFTARYPTDIELETMERLPLTQEEGWYDCEENYFDEETYTVTPFARRKRRGNPYVNLSDWGRTLNITNKEVLIRTIEATEQRAKLQEDGALTRRRKSRYPYLNIPRFDENVSTDTIIMSEKITKAGKKYVGTKYAQIFVTSKSKVIDIIPMERESHSHQALLEYLKKRGCPNKLISDGGKTMNDEAWKRTMNRFMIKRGYTTPNRQNQNRVERYVGLMKTKALMLMATNKAPAKEGMHALKHAQSIHNNTAKKSLNWKTPLQVMYGTKPDISKFCFEFYEKVIYLEADEKFPHQKEKHGRFIGIEENTGDDLTFQIRNENGEIVTRSELKRNQERNTEIKPEAISNNGYYSLLLDDSDESEDELDTNIKINEDQWKRKINGDKKYDDESLGNNSSNDETRSGGIRDEIPYEKITEEDEDGDEDDEIQNDKIDPREIIKEMTKPHHCSFQSLPDQTIEDSNFELEGDDGQDYKFINRILNHRVMGTQDQVKIEMNNGTRAWKILKDVKEDDETMLAQFLVDSKLDSLPRFKWATRTIRLKERNANARKAKIMRKKGLVVEKFGTIIPRNIKEAYKIDEREGTKGWTDAIEKEITSLHEYKVFRKAERWEIDGYTRLRLLFVFDVKHDGRKKLRICIAGNETEIGELNSYAAVARYRSIRLVELLAGKMQKKCTSGDIGNAFLNAKTDEKVYVIAGPEFGALEGAILVIDKALYGLKTSSYKWMQYFGSVLRKMGFSPTRSDRAIWIKKVGKDYDYCAAYVDDFIFVSHNAKQYLDEMQKIFTIKDVSDEGGRFLGGDRDIYQGFRTAGSETYVREAINKLERAYGPLAKTTIPMATNDNPELDESEKCDWKGIKQYQTMIGVATWCVQLGRMDICYAVSSLSRFSASPTVGQLQRLKKLMGWLKLNQKRFIVMNYLDPKLPTSREKTKMEDFKEVYPDAFEMIDPNSPDGLIEEMAITIFVDSDHAHDKKTRRSITGIIVFVGSTPVYWMSSRQGQVEGSTYGAEFAAMKRAVEVAEEIRFDLRNLGMKITKPTVIYGDNLGVVQNCRNDNSMLKKKHVAIAYHLVREAVAAGMVEIHKVKGQENIADIFTKALPGTTLNRLTDKFIY
jgi:hypothetical protein